MRGTRRYCPACRVGLAGLFRAADGTRTHDLLHGKQWLNRGFPLSMRDPGRSDTSGLPAITVDLGNEWVADARRSAGGPAPGCWSRRPRFNAVQTPARVNVTCVTPLGEEVASIS